MTPSVQTGTVVSFDERVGLGTVEAAGQDPYLFHCTQIADGSRTIDEGTTVTFVLVARHCGVWEAAELQRV